MSSGVQQKPLKNLFVRMRDAFGFIARTWKSRVAICLMLILSLVVNSLVLHQRYGKGDENYDNISDEMYSTFMGFAIAIGLLGLLIMFSFGRNNQWGTALLFCILVVWALIPEIMLFYSRPGCSVSSIETFVTAQAIASSILVSLLLLWFVPATIALKGSGSSELEQKVLSGANKCAGRADGYTIYRLDDENNEHCYLPYTKDDLTLYRVNPDTNTYSYYPKAQRNQIYTNCVGTQRCKYQCLNVPNDWRELESKFEDPADLGRSYCNKVDGVYYRNGVGFANIDGVREDKAKST